MTGCRTYEGLDCAGPEENGWQAGEVTKGERLAVELSSHNLILGSSSPRRAAQEEYRVWHAAR